MHQDTTTPYPKSGDESVAGGHILRALMALLLLAIGVGAGLAAVPTASAAPPYTTEATVTDIKFTESSVQSGSHAQLSANWSLPDNPAPTAGFTIDLPTQLVGRGDTFKLTARDSGDPIGTCVATPAQLQCDLDAGYLAANPRDIRGDVYFWVRVNDTVTVDSERDYTVGEHQVSVVVTPPNGQCTTDCPYDWSLRKDGVTQYQDGSILWFIHVAAERGGMKAGQTVRVIDTPGANLEMVVDDEFPKLTESNELGIHGGTTRPVNFTTVPRDQYTVNADNSITFVAKEGYYYEVQYKTKITDGGVAGLYTNAAEVQVDTVSQGETNGSARWAGGGGSGIGTNVGVFEITKKVTGSATVADDREYTGTYTVTLPDQSTKQGAWTVKADGTWRSPEFPRDSTVELTEDEQNGPEGVVWESPDFSMKSFPLPGGQVTAVTVTNEANKAPTGKFSLLKVVEGDAADQVADDTAFTVTYSYPAGASFPAGQGELEVKADGVVVQSPELPVGAQVTLTEADPAAIEGTVWRDATFSPATFAIADGTVVAVTLTNTVDKVPPKPPVSSDTPETPDTPETTTHASTPPLPDTGATIGLGALAVAVLLLLGGSILLGRARRR